MTKTTRGRLAWLVLTVIVAVAVACIDSSERSTGPLLTRRATPTRSRHGPGLDGGAGSDTIAPMSYWGGPIVTSPKIAVMYWAGRTLYTGGPAVNTTGPGSNDTSVVGYFLNHLGNSGYAAILTGYTNSSQTPVQDSLPYTQYYATLTGPVPGTALTDTMVQEALASLISNGLAYDPNTIYLVFLDSAVTSTYRDQVSPCSFHDHYTFNGNDIKYAGLTMTQFTICAGGYFPNNDVRADMEVGTIAHELMEAVTDPQPYGDSAWIDRDSNEVADKCELAPIPAGQMEPVPNEPLQYYDIQIPFNTGKYFWTPRMWANQPVGQCALFSLPVTLSGPATAPQSGNYTWTSTWSGSPDGTYSTEWDSIPLTIPQGQPGGVNVGSGSSLTLPITTMGGNFMLAFVVRSHGETDSTMQMIQTQPPQPYITGPTTVSINGACTWQVAATGFTGPYNIFWSVDGQGDQNPVEADYGESGGSTLTYQPNNVGNPMTINVEIDDANNNYALASLSVSPAGYGCGY